MKKLRPDPEKDPTEGLTVFCGKSGTWTETLGQPHLGGEVGVISKGMGDRASSLYDPGVVAVLLPCSISNNCKGHWEKGICYKPANL